ncbi:hypothetical protein KKH3_33510 [Pectobacterium actinidiae]|nr:hypothetical protein KKH3_33510 [Pectobacterium actinidiae]
MFISAYILSVFILDSLLSEASFYRDAVCGVIGRSAIPFFTRKSME